MDMKSTPRVPPREFTVGHEGKIRILHCADVALEPDEQVTFVTESGTAHDVVRKLWGYYATGSLNGRLVEHGLRAALAVNGAGKLYVLLVERGKEADFEAYLEEEQQRLLTWLDQDADVERLTKLLAGSK
jgi:hypothetical protein